MDDEDSEKKCLSTQHGTDINIIKLSYNSPPVSEEVERFKLMRSVFKKAIFILMGRPCVKRSIFCHVTNRELF